MWARGYFCGTVGEVDEKTIKEYIENQGQTEENVIEIVDEQLLEVGLKDDFSHAYKGGFSRNCDFKSRGWTLVHLTHRLQPVGVQYWSRNYVDLKKGEGYDKLKRTVAINILNYNIFDDEKYPDMHSCFGLFDMRTGCQLTKQLEIHFLELQKFHPMSIKEMNRMQKWAAYFSPSTPEDEMAAIVASDAEIRAAVEVEKMFTQDEVARRSYEKAEKFRRDQLAQLQYAQRRGFEHGIEQGLEQGINQERENSINRMIVTLRGLDVKEETIAAKLKEGYDLSDVDVKRYLTLH